MVELGKNGGDTNSQVPNLLLSASKKVSRARPLFHFPTRLAVPKPPVRSQGSASCATGQVTCRETADPEQGAQ